MGLFEQFPYANFHELNLDWLLAKMKELAAAVDAAEDHVDALDQAVADLREYIDNLDLTDEVREVLDEWLEDGTIETIIGRFLKLADLTPIDRLMLGNATDIGFIGDSITYGLVPQTEDTQVAHPYPEIVETRLKRYNSLVTCHNYGVNGRPSSQWNLSFERAFEDGCSIVVYMFGHNDLRLEYGINSILSNTEAFVNRCKESGIMPVVCSPNPYYGTQAGRIQQTRELAQALKNLCTLTGVVYVPVYENLERFYECGLVNTIALTPDGVHQSDYQPIADIVCAYAFPFLQAVDHLQLIAWRGAGLKSGASVATLSGLITPEPMRYANLKSGTLFTYDFYCSDPFKLSTVSADYAGSGSVTWQLEGLTSGDYWRTPATAGNAGRYTHDYYVSVSAPEAITHHTKVSLFGDDAVFPPGWYRVSLYSIARGQAPQVYVPLLYLLGLAVDRVPMQPLTSAS